MLLGPIQRDRREGGEMKTPGGSTGTPTGHGKFQSCQGRMAIGPL